LINSDSEITYEWEKCRFAVREVKYLGHNLSGKGISVDPVKTDVITNWPKPKTPKQVKSFLGVSNYYRRFIEGYSQRSAPLRELISKDKHFVWGPEQDRAFADLKSALTTAPILQYPDTNRAFFPRNRCFC